MDCLGIIVFLQLLCYYRSMQHGFWGKLKRPFLVLAPMYDVTDSAFRQILVRCGKPDVMFTEFVSAQGLLHEASQEKLINLHLRYEENERPIVAQIFSADPEAIHLAVKLIEKLGFDGVDINMGCPDKAIVKQGSGAALIEDPKRAQEIIRAACEGVKHIPVSVKTRTGFLKENIAEWIGALLKAGPSAITVHGRTKKEMSKVPANWEAIKKAVDIARGSEVLIIGNGDVQSREDAHEKAKEYGVDGIMIGRAIFQNPYLFLGKRAPSHQERMELLQEHIQLFDTYYSGVKSFRVMYKHIGNYIKGFDGAKELRAKCMKNKTPKELYEALDKNILSI